MTVHARTAAAVATTFDAMTAREDWLGFGYLGGRRNALTSTDPEAPARPEVVARVDARILSEADQLGWSAEDLFAWANSRNGRWFADATLEAGTPAEVDEALARAIGRWNLLRLPD